MGKTADAENFPVASLLLPREMRARVMEFYRFARAADDIADDPALAPEEKLRRLDGFQPNAHGAQLLQAFRRDATGDHCRDWADLMDYCGCSAVPVGRFLLDLHGEGPEAAAPADALCAAHQILNHIQDCRADYAMLGRVYLPRDWLRQAGLEDEVLLRDTTPPALRAVFDRMLDAVDGLIGQARPLPRLIRNRGLRLQASVTVQAAIRLSALLRRADPLARPVKLSKLQKGLAFCSGIVRAL